jgi:hypothetical protein
MNRRIVAQYLYRDHAGVLLYKVVRYQPKDFRVLRPDPESPGKSVWGLPAGTPRVPYLLPELLASSGVVFVCEGEKDVDALHAAGLTATTLAGGTSASWTESIVCHFRGRSVILLPDNDDPGREYMQRVGRALRPVAGAVGWLQLPDLPAKGDVSDWLAVPGNDADKLLRIATTATKLGPPAEDAPMRVVRSAAEAVRRDVVRLEDLSCRKIEWLWKPWLPLGKLCLIDGDPGQGKSYMTLDLAARLSRGDAFPDGGPAPAAPVNSLLVCCEDGLTDTVLPRLVAMKADLTRIRCWQGERRNGEPFRPPILPDDYDVLREAIRVHAAKLVIIDPLMAFLGASVNSISDQSIRQVLTPLASLAEAENVTILFVRHLNKTNGKQAVYRGGGSIGIIAAMRTAMLIARHPHNADMRVLAMVKCNLGPEPMSQGFRLTPAANDPDATLVHWEGPVDMKANDLVGDVKEALDPKHWLKELLAGGPLPATEVLEEAQQAGISASTLNRAKAALSIVSKKKNDQWYWLPPGTTNLPYLPGDPLEPLEFNF